MIEEILFIENADPVVLYGVNNSNIVTLRNLFPKLRIVARGNAVKCKGDEQEVKAFEEVFNKIERHCAQYNSLDETTLIDYVKGEL